MAAREARLVFEPLSSWPYPDEQPQPSPFDFRWATIVDHLLREADHLGAGLVVVELDVARHRIRQDGQLHQQAATLSPRARVSMDTRHGPLQWHCARYTAPGRAWQHNVRAIVLTVQYLRRIDEIGAASAGEHYLGFRAIEPGPQAGFASAAAAARWLRETAAADGDVPLPRLIRLLRARFHPDAGTADPDQYARVDEAARLTKDAGMI